MTSTPLKSSRARKLETAESLAMLQDQLLDPRGSTSVGKCASGGGDSNNTTVIGLQVSIQRGRLALIAVLTTVALIAITLILSRDGVVLRQFDKGDLTTKQQQDLVEKYNSYTGTAAAAIERPLSLFVALMVDVMVVRLMADKLLQVEIRLPLRLSALALSAGFGYLLANGLSALNVQVRELPVQYVISAQDLTRPLSENSTSSITASYPDDRHRNPVGNTILRNLLLPRALSNKPVCEGGGTMDTLDTITFGLPQLPWMQSLLSESLDTKTMTIAVGTTGETVANRALAPDQFPMNASVAAELLLYGVAVGAMGTFLDLFGNVTTSTPARYESAARLAGLISPDAAVSETVDRAWFLAHSAKFVAHITSSAARNKSSLRTWKLDLTHVPITPSIWVDAVTIEREMAWPHLETDRSQDGATRYYSTASVSSYGIHVSVPIVNETTDTMVQSYALCVNHVGEETLTVHIGGSSDPTIMCMNKSASSIFLVSSTKRLVADALIGDATANSSGVFNGRGAVVINMRQVTLWTFARISWKSQNLAETFSAKCFDDAGDGCVGLDVELPSARQRLVVSKASIPVAQPSLLMFNLFRVQQPLSIVGVARPQHFFARHQNDGDGWLGDFLLPHNVRDMSRSVTKPAAASSGACISMNEMRLTTYVNDHAFMDSTLQTTYTAAVFFLFQNGVAHDIASESETGTTLAFSQNVQRVVLRAFIPRLNVWLTLAGCGALVCALVVVVFWQLLISNENDPLQRITTPHAIARVMLDNATFPSVLLQRSILKELSGEEDDARAGNSDGDVDVDAWMIQSITVQPKVESGKEDNEQEHGAVHV